MLALLTCTALSLWLSVSDAEPALSPENHSTGSFLCCKFFICTHATASAAPFLSPPLSGGSFFFALNGDHHRSRFAAAMDGVQVGSDDDGYGVRLKLEHFLAYLRDPEHRLDDSPLYIFDGTFGDRRGSRSMGRDYSIPSFFREDLMQHAGERRRPPYRCCLSPP